jgi:hypothetical protein
VAHFNRMPLLRNSRDSTSSSKVANRKPEGMESFSQCNQLETRLCGGQENG